MPRPLRSPFFPYTTLFRSHKAADMLWKVESARSIAYAANVAAASDDGLLLRELASSAKAYASDAYFFCASENIQIDRKSTRLNSSHVRNSYAVLCLKKKKK